MENWKRHQAHLKEMPKELLVGPVCAPPHGRGRHVGGKAGPEAAVEARDPVCRNDGPSCLDSVGVARASGRRGAAVHHEPLADDVEGHRERLRANRGAGSGDKVCGRRSLDVPVASCR